MVANGCEPGINDGVLLPIVTLNRSVLVAGLLGGLLVRQPLVTTVLFLVVLGAALFGRRGSVIFRVGTRLFRGRNRRALAAGWVEERRVMRFNNAIAALFLGLAQVAFLVGAPVVGWTLSIVVAAAAAIALAGFCVGCFVLTQIALNRHRLGWSRRTPIAVLMEDAVGSRSERS